MAKAKRNTLSIEGARLIFKNFRGEKGTYNPSGVRSFCVVLDAETAHMLEEDGWNVKWLKPRDEYDEPVPYLNVAVRFDNFPPKIILISGGRKTKLDEETVGHLDWAEIENADLIINPSVWESDEGIRIKAYLKSLYVTIVEDEFAKKYEDVPESQIFLPGENE